jgi:CHAT domain-containing protein
METFYQGLAQGKGKGAALRDAQLGFVDPDGDLCDPETAALLHPYFWASFFLVGDTGVLQQRPGSQRFSRRSL